MIWLCSEDVLASHNLPGPQAGLYAFPEKNPRSDHFILFYFIAFRRHSEGQGSNTLPPRASENPLYTAYHYCGCIWLHLVAGCSNPWICLSLALSILRGSRNRDWTGTCCVAFVTIKKTLGSNEDRLSACLLVS